MGARQVLTVQTPLGSSYTANVGTNSKRSSKYTPSYHTKRNSTLQEMKGFLGATPNFYRRLGAIGPVHKGPPTVSLFGRGTSRFRFSDSVNII